MISKIPARRLFPAAICALLAVTVVVLAAASASAQPAPATKVRGVIESITPDAVTVVKKNGTVQTVQFAPNLVITALVKASLSDITQGVFIGATARPQADGTLSASEVHIFPESMRGAGEGHYPWDTAPDASMTNASVADIVAAVNGSTLLLKYKGGENRVVVTPETAIVAVAPGTRDDLKKGAAVFAIASETPGGALKTGFLLVGRGVTPPM